MEGTASSKASMQFVGVSIVFEERESARGRGARRTVRTQIYVSRETSQNPPQPSRIELTRHLPPSIFLSSARGTLVIPNSLMALDQLSRRPFAQIPVTASPFPTSPFLGLSRPFSMSCTCLKIKLSLRITTETACYVYKSADVSHYRARARPSISKSEVTLVLSKERNVCAECFETQRRTIVGATHNSTSN